MEQPKTVDAVVELALRGARAGVRWRAPDMSEMVACGVSRREVRAGFARRRFPVLGQIEVMWADGTIRARSPEWDRRAFDILMFGEFGADIEAYNRSRDARALCMPDPTDDRPLLVMLTNQPRARDNGVYRLGGDGTKMLRYLPEENAAPWWRGAVAALRRLVREDEEEGPA